MEKVAQKKGWELIPLARGGCSNTAIILQIEHAINFNPDFILVGFTGNDRLELPLSRGGLTRNIHYKKEIGLSNIYNTDLMNASEKFYCCTNSEPTLASETLSNIFAGNDQGANITRSERKVLEKWFGIFYDSSWKKQLDTWCGYYGVSKLVKSGIPFRFFAQDFLYSEDLSEFREFDLSTRNDLNPRYFYNVEKRAVCPFHITVEDSTVLANNWLAFFDRETTL